MRTWILLLAALMLAGCTTDDQNGDDADASEASISQDDLQETADCPDGDATFAGAGTVDEGNVTVTIMDGDGNEVLTETYDDAFELEGESLDGGGGTWTVEAEPADDFDGTFGLTLTCT